MAATPSGAPAAHRAGLCVHDGRRPLADAGELIARTPEESNPRLEWVYARIAKLAPVERSLMLLHLDGLSYREIAETLGIAEEGSLSEYVSIQETFSPVALQTIERWLSARLAQ